ncbi:hypothetical protein QCD27_20315, partial [Providencia stuartii]|nr:hypothetical protein [Providencia stuartii]
MTAKVKLPGIEVFMSKVDEDNFSKALGDYFKEIKFIDNYVWDTLDPPVRNSISLCYGAINSNVTIINSDITRACWSFRYKKQTANGAVIMVSPKI